MKISSQMLVGIVSLVMIQCSPLRDGIVSNDQSRTLSAEAFSIALMGDIPYSNRQTELFEKLIKEVNADPSVDLVLHAGDLKGGGGCDDQLYRDRFDLFEKFDKPFIYTIGDNDWTDCHRKDNGRYHPLERASIPTHDILFNPFAVPRRPTDNSALTKQHSRI